MNIIIKILLGASISIFLGAIFIGLLFLALGFVSNHPLFFMVLILICFVFYIIGDLFWRAR